MEFLRGVKLQPMRRKVLDNCLEVLKVRSSKPNRFQRKYNKIKARKGEKVAIVAAARLMAETVYWMLTKREYYKEDKAIRASSFS